MSLVVPWLVFPLVVGVLALGSGLLVERISGVRVPSPLLLPVGLAAIVAVSSLTVSLSTTAKLTVPLVAGVAALGFGLGHARRPDPWPLAAAAAVYLAYGLPVLASGRATFTGYVKLDDTATFLAITDRVLDHGRSVVGLAPSSYEATLDVTIAHGYPLGSVLPLGIGQKLVGTDAAWLYQPWLAFCAAMLALALYELARPLVARAAVRALVAAVAAQSALLYGFAAWGGVKELAAAAFVATAAASTVLMRDGAGLRAFLPLVLASVAVLDTLSVGGIVWLLPLAVTLVAARRHAPVALAAGLVAAAALALPALASAAEFLRGSNRAVFEDDSELGNLVGPLHALQILGIWPSGDFRVDPERPAAVAALLAVASAAALVGGAFAVRARARAFLVAIASVVSGVLVFAVAGAPWLAAKAYAIASPVVLLAALCGCAVLAVGGLGLPGRAGRATVLLGWAAGAGVIAGVIWSNVRAYQGVSVAPRSQLVELERIGRRFAAQGPALMTEYSPYGVRHFLRRLDAEGASELRRRPILLRAGRSADKAEYVDLDEISLPALLEYRTLVLRRSPTESRPPSSYRLVERGRWYDVWQRTSDTDVLEHLSLGDPLQPGGTPPCAAVRQLAGRGRIVGARSEPNHVWSLEGTSLPDGWSPSPGGAVVPTRSGISTIPIELERAGRYRLWVGGSARGTLHGIVDGEPVGSVSSQLQNAGQWLDLGLVDLAAGPHDVSLELDLPGHEPGARGGGFPLGPLLLEPEQAGDDLLEAEGAESLCGRTLDWVEAIRP